MTDKIFLNNQPERILLWHDKEIEFSSYIRKDLILTRCDSCNLDIEKKKNGLDLSCDPGPGSDLGYSLVAKHDVSIFDFVYFPKNISEPIRLKWLFWLIFLFNQRSTSLTVAPRFYLFNFCTDQRNVFFHCV